MKTTTITITDDLTGVALSDTTHLEVTASYIIVKGKTQHAPYYTQPLHFLSYDSFHEYLKTQPSIFKVEDDDGCIWIAAEMRIQAIVYAGDSRPLY